MSWNAPDVYVDGAMTTAKRVSLPEFSSPIPRNTSKYLLTEDWQMQITDTTSWTPLALNTPHPEDSSFLLVSEGPRKDVGLSSVRWTRTYAKLPPAYDEWEVFQYPFIGYFGPWGGQIQPTGTLPTGRNRQTLPVMSRIRHSFYLVDPNSGSAAGPTYDSPGHIPVVQAQKYRLVVSGTTWWMDLDFLASNPPYNFSTTPSRATYEGYCKNASQYGWDSGVVLYKWTMSGTTPVIVDQSGNNPGQLAAEDSRMTQWQGNIWLVQTRYVLAQ